MCVLFVLTIVRPLNAATIISQPEATTITARVGNFTVIPTDAGGGGFITSVVFTGYAYPSASVHVWKNGVPKTVVDANDDGYFTITLNELYSPNVLYTLFAVDLSSQRSLLLNYPVVIKTGYITQLSGIKFAPTISVDKTEVKAGDYLTVVGYAIPHQQLELVIMGNPSKTYYTESNADGTYEIIVPLISIEKGTYSIYTRYATDMKKSKLVTFTVGDITIPSSELVANIPGDCNADQIINLVDFSVAAFWYNKSNPPKCIDTNNDGVINLTDFSVLAFYWTG